MLSEVDIFVFFGSEVQQPATFLCQDEMLNANIIWYFLRTIQHDKNWKHTPQNSTLRKSFQNPSIYIHKYFLNLTILDTTTVLMTQVT